MLTSRRMLSLLLAAAAVIAILSGCYAAPVSETTEQGGETSGAIVTDSEIPVTTYPVPEMNIQVLGNMTASAAKSIWYHGRLRFDRRVLAVGYVFPALYSGL